MRTDRHIHYREGYKYQLVLDCTAYVGICPETDIETKHIILTAGGYMTLRAGYACDGPSGPAIDSPSSLRGAFFHDGTYQLIRMGLLPAEKRHRADDNLKAMCVEDGMHPVRAELWRRAVDRFAAFAADPDAERPILIAPR
jgi:hypothetical protein